MATKPAPVSPITDVPEAPESTPTQVVAPTRTTIPTPGPLVFPTLPPTPKFSADDIGPISDEQFIEEMRLARFSTDGWETNFRIRSVRYQEILGGGPGKDDIPPIDHPKFESVEQADQWLTDRDPVQVVDINGDARAYPLQIMIWHEVVNDTVGGEPVVVTY